MKSKSVLLFLPSLLLIVVPVFMFKSQMRQNFDGLATPAPTTHLSKNQKAAGLSAKRNKMANKFVVSASGTPEWDGDYFETGTYNGGPEYILDTEHRLYWALSGQWTFGDSSHPTTSASAYSDESGVTLLDGPPTGGYSAGGMAVLPSPSLVYVPYSDGITRKHKGGLHMRIKQQGR